MTGVLLHGFGQRYDLPIGLALYLYAAAGVVVVSFVLVVLFAGEPPGKRDIAYPRRPVRWLTRIARSPWPRGVGGAVGVLGLLAILITGFFGSSDATRSPAEYLTWIYFWAGMVIASGLVGNLWLLFNPWAAIFDVASRALRLKPLLELPPVGVWPAIAAYFSFACLELTSGVASHPMVIAIAALTYSVITLAGMAVFGRDQWLNHCEAFTVLFEIVGRFGPLEAERDEQGHVLMVYARPWGVGLLKQGPSGWDRVVFVILMLGSLAFDGILATTSWENFRIALKPYWFPLGTSGPFAVGTFGLALITVSFFLVFVGFMEAVMYFGQRKVDVKATVSAFSLTLVPIALVYNAAHNYSYLLVQSQGLIPLLNDPLGRGWHLWPAVANITPNFALAQASTVWYAQVILIVLGHMVAVYLSHLRAGERFRSAQRALLSQYPMLLLMVTYTMTSLWILAQPITRSA